MRPSSLASTRLESSSLASPMVSNESDVQAGTSSVAPVAPSMAPVLNDRARFLKACDRCRAKKVKCDNMDPCGRCAKASIDCTFNTDLKMLASSTSVKRKRKRTPVPRSPPTSTAHPSLHTGTCTDRESLPREQVRPGLEIIWSAHFFTGSDGAPRMSGSSSGLPMLDAAYHAAQSSTARVQAQNEPEKDWDYMSRLLLEDNATKSPNVTAANEQNYFPDRETKEDEPVPMDLFAIITGYIPQDLLALLLKTFFEVIHPSWPILNPAAFFNDLYRWSDSSCGALTAAMCMLASRHVNDSRVLATAGDPASAGWRYHELFTLLSDLGSGHKLYDIVAHFFAAQYFCTDNVPRPLAHVYAGIAFARSIDAGLHREVPQAVPISPVEREMRKRAAWAIFCWDKQAASLCGRNPFIRLYHIDIAPLAFDETYVEIFRAFISISVVLDFALTRVVGFSVFPEWKFLNYVAGLWESEPRGEAGLVHLETMVEAWRAQLGPELRQRDMAMRFQSSLRSVAAEQVAGVEMLVELLIASRRLFMATITSFGIDGHSRQHDPAVARTLREPVIKHAKSIVRSCIQMGATDMLSRSDIFFAYRVLAAARLLLACHICAKVDNDLQHAEECRQSVQAASMLLHRFAEVFPVSLGAAETLDETCRVHGLNLDRKIGTRGGSDTTTLWYRPLAFQRNNNHSIFPAKSNDLPLSLSTSPLQSSDSASQGRGIEDQTISPLVGLSDHGPSLNLNPDSSSLMNWFYNENPLGQLWSLPNETLSLGDMAQQQLELPEGAFWSLGD